MAQQSKEYKKLQKDAEKLTKELEDLSKALEPLSDMESFIDIDEFSKSIDKLKDFAPTNKEVEELTEDDFGTIPPVDGETCMHGNSWHSNCSDCDDLDDMEVVLNEIGNLIENEPNDKRLGEKIRDFYNKWLEFNQNNSDNTNKIDI